jgi:hypothetical protein
MKKPNDIISFLGLFCYISQCNLREIRVDSGQTGYSPITLRTHVVSYKAVENLPKTCGKPMHLCGKLVEYLGKTTPNHKICKHMEKGCFQGYCGKLGIFYISLYLHQPVFESAYRIKARA